MKRGEVLRDERLKHLDELRKLGVDPYPSVTTRTHTVAEARDQRYQTVSVAGRVVAIRSHGKAMFLDLQDESGKMQVYAKADDLGNQFAQLELLDEGDFLSATGVVFVTKMGETTIHATDFQILAKTLRPLPDQWQGFKDVEERFRKRYLDLLLNPEVRQVFAIRRKIFASLRAFMEENGFIEVETPTLQPIHGGASAKPFVTHYNAYETDVYLRIAPELYLKRLLVGGYEKVYEITRNFRNEGADATHNPEFTNMEFYAAYWNEEMVMEFTERLIIRLVTDALGKPEITVGDETITISAPFERIDFATLTGGDMTDEGLKKHAKDLRKPTFVINHPRHLVPLAKAKDSETARSFGLYVAGIELVKAFGELNDPLDQRRQFEEQMDRRAHGDEEAQLIDEDFLEALEHGMPPAGGFGIGLERFVALVAGQDTLRQAMYFPFMKPRRANSESQIANSQISKIAKRSKK